MITNVQETLPDFPEPEPAQIDLETVNDRFDFEQDIFNCWHIVNDIKQLYEMVSDRNTSTDDIANVLLGMQTLYDDRFSQLMTNFEQLLTVNGDIR